MNGSHTSGGGGIVVACVLIAIVASLGACGLVAGSTPTPAICDGISAEMGGCSPDRPTFSGTTCEAVGVEFGRQFDKAAVAIIEGPEDTEESKAVRIGNAMSTTASLANSHLRRVGLIKECSASDFLAAAEPEFSDTLRARAGEFLYDGTTVDYATWRTGLLDLLSIIDMEEDVRPPPS
jgi:hypothetical protein